MKSVGDIGNFPALPARNQVQGLEGAAIERAFGLQTCVIEGMPVTANELVGQRPVDTEPAARFGRDSISLQLTIVARLMRNMFDRQVAALGITRSQWSMIVAVSQLPGSTQRTIAEMLEMSEASAGRLIDRLCGDGLLERRPRSDDRRAHAVYLTTAAQPLLDQLSAAGKVLEAKLFRGFEQDDLSRLQDLLDRMYANLDRC